MARGRMVNKKISNSKQVNDLPEMAQLLFTWLIPQLDCNGCFYGSAEMVKSLVFPRKKYTEKMVEQWLLAMENSGSDGKISPHSEVLGSSEHETTENLPLIVRYFVGGEQYLMMPGFVDAQIGLRRDKEKPDFPTFSGKIPSTGRINSTTTPSEEKEKRREEEVEGEREEKENVSQSLSLDDDDVLEIAKQEKIPVMPGEVAAACAKFSHEWVKGAIKEAVMHDKREWRYVAGVLKTCLAEGHAPGQKRPQTTDRASPTEKYTNGKLSHLVNM